MENPDWSIWQQSWRNSTLQLHDENGDKSLNQLTTGKGSWLRTVRKASIKWLHRSHGQSKNWIKPELQYQHVSVTELNQLNAVPTFELEPSAGLTLLLNWMIIDCSTAAATRWSQRTTPRSIEPVRQQDKDQEQKTIAKQVLMPEKDQGPQQEQRQPRTRRKQL